MKTKTFVSISLGVFIILLLSIIAWGYFIPQNNSLTQQNNNINLNNETQSAIIKLNDNSGADTTNKSEINTIQESSNSQNQQTGMASQPMPSRRMVTRAS